MARRLHADRRGISPVVATVILVAVTIVVAVAVAYWMGGLTAIYTRFEKLEITSAYAEQWEKKEGNNTTQYYNITLNIKN
ncbi:MAG: archaellin/type IV pilin N-terminal domain-containing protein, partial [Candidatus Bathyarchaeia archaeon]